MKMVVVVRVVEGGGGGGGGGDLDKKVDEIVAIIGEDAYTTPMGSTTDYVKLYLRSKDLPKDREDLLGVASMALIDGVHPDAVEALWDKNPGGVDGSGGAGAGDKGRKKKKENKTKSECSKINVDGTWWKVDLGFEENGYPDPTRDFEPIDEFFSTDFWYRDKENFQETHGFRIAAMETLNKYFLIKNVRGDGNCLLRSISALIPHFSSTENKYPSICNFIHNMQKWVNKVKAGGIENPMMPDMEEGSKVELTDNPEENAPLTAENINNLLQTVPPQHNALSVIVIELLAVYLNTNIYLIEYKDSKFQKSFVIPRKPTQPDPKATENIYLLNKGGHFCPLLPKNKDMDPNIFIEDFNAGQDGVQEAKQGGKKLLFKTRVAKKRKNHTQKANLKHKLKQFKPQTAKNKKQKKRENRKNRIKNKRKLKNLVIKI